MATTTQGAGGNLVRHVLFFTPPATAPPSAMRARNDGWVVEAGTLTVNRTAGEGV